jgi:excisionase family DNA binding protein
MDEKIYTPDEISKKLSVKVITVQRWLRSGKLRGFKIDRIWRVRGSEFDAFVLQREKETQAKIEKG